MLLENCVSGGLPLLYFSEQQLKVQVSDTELMRQFIGFYKIEKCNIIKRKFVTLIRNMYKQSRWECTVDFDNNTVLS